MVSVVAGDERERQREVREQHGLRTDPTWVAWVAEHGTVPPMLMDIPLSDEEIREIESRQERAVATIGAFRAAELSSAAGAWLDSRAGGVVRLLLADPSAGERAVAERIVAEHGRAVVELVEHGTRELDAVRALIRAQVEAGTPFGRAVTGSRDDTPANTTRVTLRGDLHPEIPATVQAAVDAGTLIIEHPTEPYGWDPDQYSDLPGADVSPSDDEPVPRWPPEDPDEHWAHWYRCVQYVADRRVGGPLESALRLAETIGLHPRVIYPGSGVLQDLRSGRITIYVNAEHVVRRVAAE